MDSRRRSLHWLQLADPTAKAAAVRDGVRGTMAAGIDAHAALDEPLGLPGRPERPRLVAPAALAPRSAFTVDGRAALLHAVAHIEFNAINLALDAVWRF